MPLNGKSVHARGYRWRHLPNRKCACSSVRTPCVIQPLRLTRVTDYKLLFFSALLFNMVGATRQFARILIEFISRHPSQKRSNLFENSARTSETIDWSSDFCGFRWIWVGKINVIFGCSLCTRRCVGHSAHTQWKQKCERPICVTGPHWANSVIFAFSAFSFAGSRSYEDYQEGLKGHHREILHSIDHGLPYKQTHLRGSCHHPNQIAPQQNCWVSRADGHAPSIRLRWPERPERQISTKYVGIGYGVFVCSVGRAYCQNEMCDLT